MKVKIQLEDGATAPYKKHDSDAGWDLTAAVTIPIFPREMKYVPTMVRIQIDEGFFQIVGRSSMVKNRLIVPTSIIDAGYNGYLFVPIWNMSDKIYTAFEGDRIGQIVFMTQTQVTEWVEVKDIDKSETPRGSDGYGSTGR